MTPKVTEKTGDHETRVTLLRGLAKVNENVSKKNRKCLILTLCLGSVVAVVTASVLFVCFADSAHEIRMTISEKCGIKFQDYQEPATLRKYECTLTQNYERADRCQL